MPLVDDNNGDDDHHHILLLWLTTVPICGKNWTSYPLQKEEIGNDKIHCLDLNIKIKGNKEL